MRTAPAPRLNRTIILLSAGLHVTLPLSTDIYLSAIPEMARHFAVGVEGIQRTMISFSLGVALAHLFIGGLADHFGRRRVAIGGLSLYLLASFACIFSPSLDLLVAGRFIQGMAAACGPILMRAIIRDCIEPQEAPHAFAQVGSIGGWGPVAAPIAGALAALAGGWRLSLAVLFGYGLFMLVMMTLRFVETLPVEKRSVSMFGNPFATIGLMVKSRDFLLGMSVMCFGYGALLCWLSLGPFILHQHLGYTTAEIAICYGFWATGFLLGNVLCARLSQRFGPALLLSVASALAIVVLGFGALFYHLVQAPFWAIMIFMYPFYIAWGFTQPTAMAIAMRPFSAIAGQASAWFGLSQQVGASLIALGAAWLGAGQTTLVVMIFGYGVVFGVSLMLKRH